MEINHYIISSNLTWITSLALIVFVFSSGRRSLLIKSFSFYMLTICAWSFGWARMAMAADPETGLFWARFLHTGAVIIPVGFLLFALALDSKNLIQKWKPILYLGFSISLFFLIFSFSSHLVPHTAHVSGIKYYPQPGPLYVPFVFYFTLYSILSFIVLLKAFFKGSGEKQNQIKYVLVAYIIAWVGGCPAFLPVFGKNMWHLSLYGPPICVLIIAYTVLTHRLMDIRVVFRRTGLFLLIYAVLLVFSTPIFFFLHQNISASIDPKIKNLLIIEVLLLSGIFSLGPFLYAFFIRQVSFFRKDTLSGITHELKSPLSAIEGAIEYLEEMGKVENFSTEQKSDYLRMIRENSARLSQYVNSLVFALQSEKTQILFNPKWVDIVEECNTVAIANHKLAKTKNITIQLFASEPEIYVYCDPEKLNQTISNLVSNALKFSSGGVIGISITQDQKSVEVKVKDQGKGIPRKDLNRVFERFYQSEGSAKGSGLGLTIAERWVKAHGGEIWAESEGEGKGTTVSFTIPVK